MFLAKAYSSFYPDAMETTSPFALMGAMASMLTNLLPPRFVNQDSQQQGAFENAHMQMVVDTFTTTADVEALLRDPKVIESLERFQGTQSSINTTDPGERYFVKILYIKDETAALNRNDFNLLATAAIAAAQVETPSMQFYCGGNTAGTSGALVSAVKQYLNLRMNLAYFSIGLSSYAHLSEAERAKYVNPAEAVQGGSLFELPTPPEQKQATPRLPRFQAQRVTTVLGWKSP